MAYDEEGKVFKYCKLLRKTDEAVKGLFDNLVVVTEEGDAHRVPCLWATHEKLATFVDQSNPTSELDLNGKKKIVEDRIKLPIIGVYSNDIMMSGSQPLIMYTANIWTLFQEDMNQILEQVLLKFDNKKNCKLIGIARNYSYGDSDYSLKVLKSSFSLTVEGLGVPVETHE